MRRSGRSAAPGRATAIRKQNTITRTAKTVSAGRTPRPAGTFPLPLESQVAPGGGDGVGGATARTRTPLVGLLLPCKNGQSAPGSDKLEAEVNDLRGFWGREAFDAEASWCLAGWRAPCASDSLLLLLAPRNGVRVAIRRWLPLPAQDSYALLCFVAAAVSVATGFHHNKNKDTWV